ncbi:LytR C-terminal domain-containing protein [Cellulomonas sp. ATA003]|uniref:LytR C-terminal domain-containing protein n=1 Tax=Cellulomonas sp. ATA003 TaxID=3073064 RepID=UPI002873053C|nr:LytR C-terminal domain-containing protein [Cellulomonas sp. ATA003]WNB85820.1 LytR C-terminal domain-containing protein [Cellulomonas sp. ATA003]
MPPEGTLPVAYGEVQVRVLNATDRRGLAGQTADALTARGFAVAAVGNATSSVVGPARISFGAPGVGAAYTLAAHLEGARLTLDERTDATVDLALGSEFVGLLDPGLIPLDPNAPSRAARAACLSTRPR